MTDGKGNDATIGSSWFFNFPGSGGAAEMRLGVRTKDGDKTGFLNLCTGNVTNNEKADLVATNDWMEVSIVMTGRVVRLSCGIPGKLRRWATHTIPTGSNYPTSVRPTLFRLGDCSRGATESCDNGNADGFRGWIETVGIWNRGLTDAEVIEAFGGPNPGIVGVGEEGASAKMFAGAKATGAVTLGLQHTSLDSAMVYDARCGLGSFSPLFNPFTYNPHKAYYAFKAFNEAYKLKHEVACRANDPDVYALAAGDATGGVVVLANPTATPRRLVLDFGALRAVSCILTDADRTYAEVPVPEILPPESFVVLRVASLVACRGQCVAQVGGTLSAVMRH